MKRSINNLNTLNALIRDESMASKDYAALSKDKSLPVAMRKNLMKMSKDEANHKKHLEQYRAHLKKVKQ